MVSKIVFNTRELGASDGIIGVPAAIVLPGVVSTDPVSFYLVTLAFVALVYAGLAYVIETPFGTTLSGGEQQMLAIARVLAGEPRLLLIDEPTEGLALMIVDELFGLMAGLARDGIPIVLVEQNVTRAVELASRFYVLERGQVVLEVDAGSAADREKLLCRSRCSGGDSPTSRFDSLPHVHRLFFRIAVQRRAGRGRARRRWRPPSLTTLRRASCRSRSRAMNPLAGSLQAVNLQRGLGGAPPETTKPLTS